MTASPDHATRGAAGERRIWYRSAMLSHRQTARERWLARLLGLLPTVVGPRVGALLPPATTRPPSATDPAVDRTLARRIDGASLALALTLGRHDPRRLCRRVHARGLERLADTPDVVPRPPGREPLAAGLLALYAPAARVVDGAEGTPHLFALTWVTPRGEVHLELFASGADLGRRVRQRPEIWPWHRSPPP